MALVPIVSLLALGLIPAGLALLFVGFVKRRTTSYAVIMESHGAIQTALAEEGLRG